MIEAKIDSLAYQLKENRKKGKGAIVFIGAGCSVSAQIPAASKIVEEILRDHKDDPSFKNFVEKPTYEQLMACLKPSKRKEIFKGYVEKAKINVCHIYLAHLVTKGYVDYIVTVNFDNLAQRALALYNIFPPTYDISILNLKDLTTTPLQTQSITYLHGQYNGLWQLNTADEMRKVHEGNVAKSIFDKITNERLWIVVGYGGDDFIFDELVKLGRFDNGLYWVGYKENTPTSRVQNGLLNKPNSESCLIRGYDADSFFLKLNAELDNETPKIFETPFSFLSELLEGIKDIDDSEEYKSVKERFINSKEMVIKAIYKYEKTEESQIRNALINCLISEKYERLESLEKLVREKYFDLLPIVANIYFRWGNSLGKLAQTKSGDEAVKLFNDVFDKYKAAIQIKTDFHEAYNNWGTYLADLAKSSSGEEAIQLFKEAFDKFSIALQINSDYPEAYNNWGTSLAELAKITSVDETIRLFKEAFKKYKAAIHIKPDLHDAYYNWGTDLGELAKTTSGAEAVRLFEEAFEKYKKAIEIKPDDNEVYFNWGNFLLYLAKTTCDDKERAHQYFNQAFEKYKKAIEIKPDDYSAYFNWGNSLLYLAKTTPDDEEFLHQYFNQAFEKYEKAVEIKPDYNEAYFNWLTHLLHLVKTKFGDDVLNYFYQVFEKFNQSAQIRTVYLMIYFIWGTYLEYLAKTKSGIEAEKLYHQSFEKYNKAIQINSDFLPAYNDLVVSILDLARTKSGQEAEELYSKALELSNKIIELGYSSYNLSCIYAMTNKLEEAFELLETCLKKNDIIFEYLDEDLDWQNLREDPRYLSLKAKYSK